MSNLSSEAEGRSGCFHILWWKAFATLVAFAVFISIVAGTLTLLPNRPPTVVELPGGGHRFHLQDLRDALLFPVICFAFLFSPIFAVLCFGRKVEQEEAQKAGELGLEQRPPSRFTKILVLSALTPLLAFVLFILVVIPIVMLYREIRVIDVFADRVVLQSTLESWSFPLDQITEADVARDGEQATGGCVLSIHVRDGRSFRTGSLVFRAAEKGSVEDQRIERIYLRLAEALDPVPQP